MKMKRMLVLMFSLSLLLLGLTIPGTLAVTAAAEFSGAQAGQQADEKESVHLASCTADCADEACKCTCHLFGRIMACQTLDEIWAVMDDADDEAINALTEAQNAQIDIHIEELEPAPAPAVVTDEEIDETVPSEIVYPTVNYTNVAPFGDPVVGGEN